MSATKHSLSDLSDNGFAAKRHHADKSEDKEESTGESSPVQELLSQSAGFGCALSEERFAKCMDRIDPIRNLREEFDIPLMKTIPTVDKSLVNFEDDGIYMCGHSLGLKPVSVLGLMKEEVDKWANMGVLGHFAGSLPWAICDDLLTGKMAKLVGAKEDEVAIMNGLSVNLHLLLLSFYQPTRERNRILIEEHAFPSDHYIAESQISFHGYCPKTSLLVIKPKEGEYNYNMSDVLDVIETEGDSIAVILLPGIQYYTGQIFNMQAITEAAHRKGCIVGFDLAHAVGNIELFLHDWGVDFAAWCTYKYLNSGAGALAGAFQHDKHNDSKLPRLTGWFGHRLSTRFQMTNEMDLEPGICGYRITNPSIMAVVPIKASLEIFEKTSMKALRKKSLLLTGYLDYLVRLHFSKSEVTSDETQGSKEDSEITIEIITTSDVTERGSQLSLLFSTSVADILKELMSRGVIVRSWNLNLCSF